MSRPRRIKLLLADDHALVREGIRSSLVRHPTIQIVGEATNGKEVLRKTRQLAPDVVLMDLNMPEMSGLEATPLILRSRPATKVIALTVHDSKEYVFQILRTGAHGYLLKDSSPDELLRAIHAVVEGEAFFSPRISRMILQDAIVGGNVATSAERRLSSRETDVLRSIAQGNTSKEAASLLNLSVRTVETYRVRIKRKLEARNTAEMLKRARERNLI